MTLDIRLSPQAEAKLREQARASGKDLGALASELLESAVTAAEPASAAAHAAGQTLDRVLAPLIEEARRLPRQPRPAPLRGTAAEFAEAVAADLRRQGYGS